MESEIGEPQAGSRTSDERLYLGRRVWEKLGEERRAGFKRAKEAGSAGWWGPEGGGAPRGINSRPAFDRRCGDWRCRPRPPAAWGGEERSELAGRGRRTPVSWWRRQEAEGEEPRRGVEGGGRERGGGHHCSPRRALCRRRRLGGWGSVGRRGRGSLRGAASLCFVSSSPCGAAWAAGEAPAPSGRSANGAAASPRPC